MADTLNSVEDEYSGVPMNPDPGLEFDGRMYPPRSDYTKETEDGGLRARTRGHAIHAGPDGSLRLESVRSGKVEFEKAGVGMSRAARIAQRGQIPTGTSRAARIAQQGQVPPGTRRQNKGDTHKPRHDPSHGDDGMER